MKIDKFTKIEKAFLREKIDKLSEEDLTVFKIEGIYWIYNQHLTPVLAIKLRDIVNKWVKYIPFNDIEIKSTTPFKSKYSFWIKS